MRKNAISRKSAVNASGRKWGNFTDCKLLIAKLARRRQTFFVFICRNLSFAYSFVVFAFFLRRRLTDKYSTFLYWHFYSSAKISFVDLAITNIQFHLQNSLQISHERQLTVFFQKPHSYTKNWTKASDKTWSTDFDVNALNFLSNGPRSFILCKVMFYAKQKKTKKRRVRENSDTATKMMKKKKKKFMVPRVKP